MSGRDVVGEQLERERQAALLDGSAFELSVIVSVQQVNIRRLPAEALRVGAQAVSAYMTTEGMWLDSVTNRFLTAHLLNDIVMAPSGSNREVPQWIGTYRVGVLKGESDG